MLLPPRPDIRTVSTCWRILFLHCGGLSRQMTLYTLVCGIVINDPWSATPVDTINLTFLYMVACVTKQGGIWFYYFKVYEKYKGRQKIRIFVDILFFRKYPIHFLSLQATDILIKVISIWVTILHLFTSTVNWPQATCMIIWPWH